MITKAQDNNSEDEYKFIKDDTDLTKEQLVKKHNELIEEIWYLQYSLKQLDENYELMLNAYEDASDKLYG